MTIAYLGLGANLGETLQTMQHAIASLAQRTGIAVRARSGFYRSAPVQADGPPYANCVVCVETSLEPRLTERAFALAPLLELAPDIEIPRRGRAAEFLASVAAQQISRITETGMK